MMPTLPAPIASPPPAGPATAGLPKDLSDPDTASDFAEVLDKVASDAAGAVPVPEPVLPPGPEVKGTADGDLSGAAGTADVVVPVPAAEDIGVLAVPPDPKGAARRPPGGADSVAASVVLAKVGPVVPGPEGQPAPALPLRPPGDAAQVVGAAVSPGPDRKQVAVASAVLPVAEPPPRTPRVEPALPAAADRQAVPPVVTAPGLAVQPLAVLTEGLLWSDGALPRAEPFVPGPDVARGAPVAGPATATGSSAPVAQSVAQQIAATIVMSPDNPAEVLLSPRELGRVRIRLLTDDLGVTVMIQADRAETADLMRRNVDLLTQELRAMGYRQVDVAFGDAGTGDQPGAEDDGPRPRSRGASEVVLGTDPDSAPGAPVPRAGLGLLDIRL